ncbi:MAG: ABC transporter ATP-binding protein [Alphaproteobacteria bacterium]|nr:ABC transporter ATP-binding protein [Alphaproteobacteria bacterium]
MTAPAIITLANVNKTYHLYGSPLRQMLGYLGLGTKNVPTKHALSNINITIRKGERVGIVGHNGSGKTTLLRTITGYTRPSSGSVEVVGSTQALMQRGYGFNDHLSGLENIRNAMVYNGLPKHALDLAEADIVDFVELGEFLYHPVKTYSLGMRARLEFAAATAIHPSVLVIDEVLGAGDGYFVRKCAARMRNLMDNTTLLLVSHSLDQIKEYCERVIWLDAGIVREDGPTDAVLAHYRSYMNTRTSELQNEAQIATQTTLTPQASLRQKLLRSLGVTQQIGVINHFAFQDHEGKALVTETGKPLGFALDVTVPPSGQLQPLVLGVTEHGGFAFELELGAPRGEGNHSVTAASAKSEIGVGDYVLFPALRDMGGTIVALGEVPLTLSMAVANWSDPPLVHFDADWQAGGQKLTSKISAWV